MMKPGSKYSIRSINGRRALGIAGMISLFAIYPILWFLMIGNPAERTGADFIAFYAAGRVAQEHGAANAYDIELQQDVQEAEVGFQLVAEQVLLYNHMPYLIPLLHGLVTPNYTVSFLRWVVLLIGIYVAGLFALTRWFPKEMQPMDKWLFLGGSATLFPLFVSLLLGQDTAFWFLGAALLGWGVIHKQDWLAGVGLALVTVRPHFALLLALPFLFSRRRVFWWFLLFAGGLVGVSVALLGIQGMKDFINILLISAGGEWYGMNEDAMYNLIGILSRSLSFLDPSTIRAIGWVVYSTAILAVCIWAARAKEMGHRMLSWIFIACILAVPHFHYHDLAILLFPILSAGSKVETSPLYRWIQSALHPLTVSFILLIGSLDTTVQFILPYLVVAGLALLLYRQSRAAQSG